MEEIKNIDNIENIEGIESIDELVGLFEDRSRPMSKSERTRLKIMVSAAKVFNKKGFSETSIQDIADNAGIAKGTIYYYVEKKEDLLISLIRFAQARLFSKIEKNASKATTSAAKIEAVIRSHLSAVRNIGPIIPFFVQNIVSDDSRVRDVMTGLRDRYLDVLISAIEEGISSGEFRKVDPKPTAVAILGMVIGQLLQHKVFTGKLDVKQVGDITVDMVIRALRNDDED